MPRFFFDVSDGRCTSDTQGVDFVDDRAARREAVRRAAMLLRAMPAGSDAVRAWRIAVKDERGMVLFRIDSGWGAALASS